MGKNSDIIVYNKHGELKAVFSNNTAVHDTEKKKNTLTSPLIHTVSNGDSTFSFSILEDSTKWQEARHPENKWHCDGRVYTMLAENNVQKQGDIYNVTLYEDWYLLDKEFVQAHNVDLNVEAMDIHTVKVLPKTSSQFRLTVDGVAYSDSDVVDSRGVLQPRGSAGYSLWAMLKGNRQGWRMGVCDVIVSGFDVDTDYGTFNLESDKLSRLENIKNIQSLWGGILVWDSLNKIVHLRDTSKSSSDFNTWKGFTAFYGKNMMEEPQLIEDNKIVTRAYPLGNGDIHIKSVNDGIIYLDNFSWTTDVYEAYIVNDNIHYTGESDLSGQRQLKFWGEQYLAKLCKPRTSYLFSIFDRSDEEAFKHETFDANDVIRIFVNDTQNDTEYIEQRIIDLQKNPWDKSNVSVLTGEKELYLKEIFELTYENNSTTPQPDWNGDYNGNDFMFDLTDELKDLFGGGSRQGFIDITNGQIKLQTAYEERTNSRFMETTASIDLISNELGSQILLEAQHYQEVKGELNSLDKEITRTNASVEIVANDVKAGIRLEATYENDTIGYWTQAFIDITSTEDGGIIKIQGDKVIVDNLYPYRIVSQYDDNDYLTIGAEGGFADLTWYSGSSVRFQIYDEIDVTTLKIQDVEILRYSSSLDRTYALGTWNFTEANIVGVDTEARFG